MKNQYIVIVIIVLLLLNIGLSLWYTFSKKSSSSPIPPPIPKPTYNVFLGSWIFDTEKINDMKVTITLTFKEDGTGTVTYLNGLGKENFTYRLFGKKGVINTSKKVSTQISYDESTGNLLVMDQRKDKDGNPILTQPLIFKKMVM